jgi:prepilin-type processing-associated H-X9-DG protein
MRRLLPTLLGLALAAPAAAAPATPAITPLDYIPPDAALVVHARMADLWKSDGLKDVRRIILKAGPDALATLDRRFSPAPSTADRVTAYIVAPAGGEGLQVVALLSFASSFDKAAVLKNTFPGAKPIRGKQTDWYGDEADDLGVLFLTDRTLAFGNYRGVARLAAGPPARATAATTFPELADPAKLVVVAANLAGLPPSVLGDMAREFPPALRPILKAKAAVVSLDAGADSPVHLRLTYPDRAAADAADKAIRDGVAHAKGLIGEARVELRKKLDGDGKPAGADALPDALLGLAGLGALQEAEDLLDGLPLKRSGETFTLAVPVPSQLRPLVLGSGLAAGFAVPAVQRIRLAANRMKDSNNLKQMALAMHNYHDVNDSIPAAICDNAGKPLLSWRVAILPFIEQENLYKEFKLDEAWDSDHNKKLLDKMPKVYEVPGAPVREGRTHYRTFVGAKAPWADYAAKAQIPGSIPDGTSNTWMIVTAADAVEWTKPDELAYDGEAEPKLSKFFGGGFNAAFWDGSVRFFPKVPTEVHKLINPNDGQPLGK